MKPCNLSTAIGDIEVVVELPEGASTAIVFVTLPGGTRVHHPVDVSRLLHPGLSIHDALDQTLQAVAVGVYVAGLQRVDPSLLGHGK